jgi:predicted 2-oxoglutarate/Fe(II)-dependent dioxygenase YbiX
MSQSVEYFEKNGYVVLKDAMSKEQCAQLTEHMFKLLAEGRLNKDEQCPLSDAVYGDPIFDNILQKFAKPIGDSVGRTLLPTYTYARIYRPGEILAKHKDRPACEISATMTLGYDSKPVWPIFFDEEREIPVDLDTGELAVYKGCDVLHWRTAFKGKWHVQVFLHYVDANGPYRNHVKDGRQEYGTQKNMNVQNPARPVPFIQQYEQNKEVPAQQSTQSQQERKFSKPIFNSVIIPNSDKVFPGYFCIDKDNLPGLKFTPQECKKIIDLTQQVYPTSASIGGTSDNSKIARGIRSANIFVLENDEENRWIYEKVANAVSVANTLHFDYDIAGITHGIQLIEYSADMPIKGHYDWHVDSGNGEPALRKISFTAQLSDPSEYEGCELIINNHAQEMIGTKERGSIHLFPSYMLHKVAPITRGVRYALVIWIHGSRRFR